MATACLAKAEAEGRRSNHELFTMNDVGITSVNVGGFCMSASVRTLLSGVSAVFGTRKTVTRRGALDKNPSIFPILHPPLPPSSVQYTLSKGRCLRVHAATEVSCGQVRLPAFRASHSPPHPACNACNVPCCLCMHYGHPLLTTSCFSSVRPQVNRLNEIQ